MVGGERRVRSRARGAPALSGFTADWLRLREPVDIAARSSAVVEAVRRRAPRGKARTIVDLGSGTGANLRYLAPRLGGSQRWWLVDHDAALLESGRAILLAWARGLDATVTVRGDETVLAASAFSCSIKSVHLDLAHSLEALELPRGCLVTAAALLDLVSPSWLEALAERCTHAAAAVLFALIYNGRIELVPRDADDEWALRCFNRHQRTDKGFGPALGPDAATAAHELFAARGYELSSAASDWQLVGRQKSLQGELVDGWLAAGREVSPEEAERLKVWHARHRQRIERGELTLVVGHADLGGSPSKRSRARREPTRSQR